MKVKDICQEAEPNAIVNKFLEFPNTRLAMISSVIIIITKEEIIIIIITFE